MAEDKKNPELSVTVKKLLTVENPTHSAPGRITTATTTSSNDSNSKGSNRKRGRLAVHPDFWEEEFQWKPPSRVRVGEKCF